MNCVRREAGAHRPAASTPSRPPSSRQSPPRDSARPDRRGERARLSLLLPVAALLLDALGLFAAAPAQAQTTVWSAMIEVDRSYYGGIFGCSNSRLFHANCADRLSDNDFVYRGVTYTVTAARWLESDKVFQLSFAGLNRSSIPARFAGLPAWAAKKALGGLTLHVGNGRAGISNSGWYLTLSAVFQKRGILAENRAFFGTNLFSDAARSQCSSS